MCERRCVKDCVWKRGKMVCGKDVCKDGVGKIVCVEEGKDGV